MLNRDIYNAVSAFHSAIMEAKHNNEFYWRDRMSNFPCGCCDDACDLLAYYLCDKFGMSTKQGKGFSEENDTYHAWLIADSEIIIDITIDQFKECSEFASGIYVGKENVFYQGLEDKVIYKNCDITQDERLWSDYLKIMKYI